MEAHNDIPVSTDAKSIQAKDGELIVPNHPIIFLIDGDGVGP
jgi:isocitrate dehydrogenase